MEFCGANNAQRNFPALLNLVSQGERITITRHGKPIAILSPSVSADKSKIAKTISKMLEQRKANQLKGLSIREMREWGRQ